MGNNNPALWRIGSADENGVYMAVTDAKVPTRFNISDLSTIGQEYPPSYPFTLNGCTHWMREPGTDNSIYYRTRIPSLFPFRPQRLYSLDARARHGQLDQLSDKNTLPLPLSPSTVVLTGCASPARTTRSTSTTGRASRAHPGWRC